jgi:2-amino-4-deoxychorismate synthase
MTADLLSRVLTPTPPPFAIIHRPEHTGTSVQVLVGDVTEHPTLADIPLPEPGGDVLVVVPYRQIAERGFEAPDDGTPLLAMTIADRDLVPVDTALARLPRTPISLSDGHFDLDDDAYAAMVRRVVDDEIGTGVGANFVLKRSFVAQIDDYDGPTALSFFRRLLEREENSYWTFVIHTGTTTLVGATPERHISLDAGTVVTNPISGTYRYPPGGPTLDGLMEFLADRKETDELYMVLDEGLKMMARICDEVTVTGPFLKEMRWLAHTGYQIDGRTDRDVREILRETMFAATVTGSPLESAARVIRRYEPEGRGYYSGVAALISRDENGAQRADSAILIRTAAIDPAGRVRISAGATLVRHSDPAAEAAETRVKMAGVLNALSPAEPARFGGHPLVRQALRRRNDSIADFWQALSARTSAEFAGLTAVVVDGEDTFTAMLRKQLEALGLSVDVRRYDSQPDLAQADLLVMGPGPGDPRAVADPKIAAMGAMIDRALDDRRPLLAICLSHQLLALRLGFDLRRLDRPNQGVQRKIDLFGTGERVAFYNTFAAFDTGNARVEVSRDERTGEVYALRGPRLAGLQFHPESIMTVDGTRLLSDAVRSVL